MRIALFYHSLISDWNHGNAHFLRGVVSELLDRGHDVEVFEPEDAWSVRQLLADAGPQALEAFHRRFPELDSTRYRLDALLEDLEEAVGGADLVLVHEWNDPRLVTALGHLRTCGGGSFALLFHDTHHRSVTDPRAMASLDLAAYDGVLAFGEVIRQRYLEQRWARRAWTWHEAADTRHFRPLPPEEGMGEGGQVVWIGNWGDEERSEELHEFLLEPVARLGLDAAVHGVRYPQRALDALEEHGLDYRGWLPNFQVPRVFARFRVTVHVPRRPYVEALPGVPTIRPFEALACGIPLVCSPWEDAEGLFRPGTDYRVARNGAEMERHLRDLVHDEDLRRELAANGRETVLSHHTCRHRVDELLAIAADVGVTVDPPTHVTAGVPADGEGAQQTPPAPSDRHVPTDRPRTGESRTDRSREARP